MDQSPPKVPVLMMSWKISTPFHRLRLILSSTIGSFHLEPSNSLESQPCRGTEPKLFDERYVSESESFDHLPDARPRKPPPNLCVIFGIMTNIVSTISIVSNTQENIL
jgi:hypothetical protein